MKRAFSLMLVFLLLFIAGCVNDDDDDDDKDANNGGGSAVGVQAADYLPLKSGSSWNYTETGMDYGEPFTENTTARALGTIQKNGKTYNVMEEDGDSTFVRVDGGLILTDNIYIADDENEASEKIAVARKAVAKAVAENDELIWFDFDKEVGSGWTMFEDGKTLTCGPTTIKVVGQRNASETVVVPSGTFKDCAKFTVTLTYWHHHSTDDDDYEYTYTSTVTYWLAKHVGIVKITSIDVEDFSDMNDEDPSDYQYNSVTTLDSYSIAE